MYAPLLTKKAINAIQVTERRSMRVKQQQSAFVNTTRNRYAAMAKRAAEFGVKALPFTLQELREHVAPFIGTLCKCGAKLTAKSIALDHEYPVSRASDRHLANSFVWALSNIALPCKKCNFRKGSLLPQEYDALAELLHGFSPESREDVWRRLVIGGKWSFK